MHHDDDLKIENLLVRCFDAINAGSTPDLDAICGEHPELRARVAKLLARELDLVKEMRGEASQVASEAPAGVLEGGTLLGEFRIVEPLGAGGMGDVYVAVQEPLGRRVALKVLSCRSSVDRAAALRFRREAEITAALDHPNIVPVFATGEASGVLYLAMKLLDGPSLDRAGRLEPRVAGRIGAAVARALDAAHRIGVIHRDIKPANIVLEGDAPFVLDFGLARSDTAATLTRENAAPGTLPYMAPEQILGRAPVDPRIDVYGLGATLYEALSGSPPFDPDRPASTVRRILTVDPPRLRGIERDLEVIVGRAMDKDPARRFQTAAEMADDLERYLAGVPIRSRAVSGVQRAWRLIRRHRATSSLVFAVASLLLGLGVVLWLQARDSSERWVKALTDVAAAIAAGDLGSARRQLTTIGTEFGEDERSRDLHAEVATEARLQALMAALLEISVLRDRATIAGLVDEIATSRTRLALSPRANAALAIASHAVAKNPPAQRLLRPATGAAWPRTAAALTAWSQKQDPVAVLPTEVGPDHDQLDHLFAAVILRLASCPELLVERELRLADTRGPDGEAIRYGLATSKDKQGQYAFAYDLYAELVDSPVFAPLANSGCARASAQLGRRVDARRHLERALAAADQAPHLRDFVAPTELEVLMEVGDMAVFWQRWREQRPRFERRSHFWLRGGYAETLDTADTEALARARAHFERALTYQPSSQQGAMIEIALLQLDLLQCPGIADTAPLAAEESTRAERLRLAEIAERAELLAAKVVADRSARDVAADALLAAASAWRLTGNVRRGWQLLEEVCRDYDQPEPLARYAILAGYRVLNVQLGYRDDEPEGPTLAAAAAKGMLRGQTVLKRAATDATIQPVVRDALRGLFLCALHLHDASVALPAALQLRDEPGLDSLEKDLCELAIAEGGVSLKHLLADTGPEPSAQTRLALLDACAAMDRALAGGTLAGPAIFQVLQHWLAHRQIETVLAGDDPAWAPLRAAITALEARAVGTAASSERR